MPGGQAHKVNDQFGHEFTRDEVAALKEIAAAHIAGKVESQAEKPAEKPADEPAAGSAGSATDAGIG